MRSDPLLMPIEAKNADDLASATEMKGSDPIKSIVLHFRTLLPAV